MAGAVGLVNGGGVRRTLGRAVGWMIVSRGGMQVVSFLSTLFVMRLLQPSDYGLVALAGAWTHTAMWLSQLGMGAAIVQFRDLDDRELNGAFWLTAALAFSGYALLFAAGPAMEAWFATPDLSAVSRVLSVTIILASLQVVPTGLLRQQLKLERIAQAEVVAGLLTIPTVLGLAWHGAGVWALVVGVLVTQVTQTVVIWVASGWWPGVRMGSPRIGALIHFGMTTLGGQLCWMIYSQADVFVLGRASGTTAVGLYSMAKQFSTVLSAKISSVTSQIASPVMAEQQDDRAALRRLLLGGVRYLGWAVIPSGVALVLVADALIRVLLTAKWLPTLPVIYVLSIYSAISALATLLPPVLSARYRVTFLFWYHGALLLVLPLAFWIGAHGAGALGVALAWSVVAPVMTGWLARETLREIGMSWRVVWEELRAPIVASVFLAISVGLVDAGLSAVRPHGGVVDLIVLAATACAAYASGLFFFGGAIRPELVGMLNGLRRARPAWLKASP
jgi:teichuronic acid exporter